MIFNNNTVNKYPVDSIVVTATNENPSQHLGGAWELIDKDLKNAVYSLKSVGITLLNATSAEVYATTFGKTVNVQVTFIIGSALGEDSVKWFEVDWTKIGLTGAFPWSNRVLFYSDGGNGVAFGTIHYNDGSVMTNDVVVKGGGTEIPSGSTVYGAFTLAITNAHLLDDFCDKFYWKRVA